MNLRPPDRVKIGPHRYDVAFEERKFRNYADDCYLLGEIDYQQGTIRLAPSPPSHQFETFLHECLHGMDRVAYTHLKESAITRLAHVLAAFLIDNGYVDEE